MIRRNATQAQANNESVLMFQLLNQIPSTLNSCYTLIYSIMSFFQERMQVFTYYNSYSKWASDMLFDMYDCEWFPGQFLRAGNPIEQGSKTPCLMGFLFQMQVRSKADIELVFIKRLSRMNRQGLNVCANALLVLHHSDVPLCFV